jgi:hypothetical protein
MEEIDYSEMASSSASSTEMDHDHDVENEYSGEIPVAVIENIMVADMEALIEPEQPMGLSSEDEENSGDSCYDSDSSGRSTPSTINDVELLVERPELLPRAWNKVSSEIRNLYDQVVEMLSTRMEPSEFVEIFFTHEKKEIRRTFLLQLLKQIWDDGEWWIQDKRKHKMNSDYFKVVKACKQWGIEDQEGIVKGEGSPSAGFHFIISLVKTIRRLSKDPERAKKMLDNDFPSNERNLSWEESIAKATKYAMDQSHCITLGQVQIMDTLLINKMLDVKALKGILKQTLKTFDNLQIDKVSGDHLNQGFCLAKSHADCVEVKEMTWTVVDFLKTYIQFMEENDGFVNSKTEFIVFHSEFALKFMEEFLFTHRKLLKLLAELGNEFEDPFWIV